MSSDSQPVSQPAPFKFEIGDKVRHKALGDNVYTISQRFSGSVNHYNVSERVRSLSEENLTAVEQPTPMPQKSLGQIAYDEYNKTVPRDDSWENQGAYLRRRWEAAAKAVADQTCTGEYWQWINDEVSRMRERINELEKERNAQTERLKSQSQLITAYQSQIQETTEGDALAAQTIAELEKYRDTLQNDLTTQWGRLRMIAHVVGHTMGDDSSGLPVVVADLVKHRDGYREVLVRIADVLKLPGSPSLLSLDNNVKELVKNEQANRENYCNQQRASAERERRLREQLDRYLTPAQPVVSAVSTDKPLGQVAFEAWNDHGGMPWSARTDDGKAMWNKVAQAVLEAWGPPQPKQSLSGKLIESTYQADFGVYYPAGLNDRQLQIVRQCLSLLTTLINKNRDYGDSAFKSPALMPSLSPIDAVAVRMSDKIARIANLSSSQRSSGPAVSDESLIDSYLDLAGYSILQVINLREATPHRINGQHSAAAYKQALDDKGTVCGGDPIQSKEQYEAVWGPGSYDAMRGFIPPPPRDEGAVQRGY